MIMWHIIAYFLIVTADIADIFFWKNWKTYAIASYCLLLINLACNIILALIINTICTKCITLKPSDDN